MEKKRLFPDLSLLQPMFNIMATNATGFASLLKQGELVLAVSFFNQPYLADKIELGQTVAVFGKWDKAKGTLTGMKLLAQVEDDLQPVYR